MKRVLLVALFVLLPLTAAADEPTEATLPSHLSRFGDGAGPSHADGTFHLLDEARTNLQSNAVAFDREHEGAHARFSLRCKMRVLEGGDGGSFLFLNTAHYGAHGPAPFLSSWVEPNLKETFAVGVDVHNPPSKEQFTPWGNYQDLPQREISLHWDGRELVKRVAPEEFRGDFADLEIAVRSVVGGAAVTVTIAGGQVYDEYFVAGMHPYEMRLAIGAGTRADATTAFDVKDVRVEVGDPARKRRPPLHVEVFNHVLTDNSKTSYTTEVDLPPIEWAFGRVILTLEIHDAGKDWDEWDRNGEVSVFADDGVKLGIVPFITSYRTECHWKVDVTHFRPLLAGKRKLEVKAGTHFYKNRGYMMSVSLDYYHGFLERNPFRVVPLWSGTAKYKSAANHFQDFFSPLKVTIDKDAWGAKLFITTTGHSQVGEFAPSKRTVVFSPVMGTKPEEQVRFENTLWKTDVYLNPNRPQFGTWQYSRAGWAPGDVVRPWWIDLTEHIVPGQQATFRYEPQAYDFGDASGRPTEKQIDAAQHVIRSYLILYRKPIHVVTAPILLVTNVTKDSNADKAGIKAGDYLFSYDGKDLDTVDDLRAGIEGGVASGKEQVTVVVYRGTKRLELQLKPGKMGVGLGTR